MTIEYKINEQDFLDFQMFTASQSKRINQKKKNGWILLIIGSIVFAIYFFLKQDIVVSIYLVLVALACGLFYPKYFIWRYKKHYKVFIKENYSKRFGETEFLEIREDSIFSKDKTGEGKINISEIEKVDETNKHFFLKISTGLSLIIPKDELKNLDEVRTKFQALGLIVNNMTNWKWK
jgi:hypothetical protein